MLRIATVGSQLISIGYNPSIELLEVEFQYGAIFQYDNVPLEIYRGLMASPSKDRYFHRHVANLFPVSRVS